MTGSVVISRKQASQVAITRTRFPLLGRSKDVGWTWALEDPKARADLEIESYSQASSGTLTLGSDGYPSNVSTRAKPW